MLLAQRPPSPPACGTPNPPFWCGEADPTPAPIDEWSTWIFIAVLTISSAYMMANLFILWRNTGRKIKQNEDYLQKKYENNEVNGI